MKRQRSNSSAYVNRPFKRARGKSYQGGIQIRSVPIQRYRTVARPRGSGGAETKIFESAIAGITIATVSVSWQDTELDPLVTPVANIKTLFAPVQGNAINNRIANKVFVKKIVIRGAVYVPAQINQSTLDNAPIVRLVMFMDKQTNGTQVQGETLLSTPVNSSVVCPWGFQNVENFGRFQVIKDKFITFPSQMASYDGVNVEVGGSTRMFKFTYKPKVPIKIQFNATNGGTVADIVDHSFHLIGATTTTGAAAEISYIARTYYTD